MQRSATRFALPLIGLLLLPFIYNSCQGGLLGRKGFSSASSSSTRCKVGLEKGVLTKLDFKEGQPPPAFALQKVRLKEDLDQNTAQAKASGPLIVEAGQKLGIILNNTCLQENRTEIYNTVVTKAAVLTTSLLPDLDTQAYEWILDRDYTDTEIEDLAQQEACVVGISWNRAYKIQSTFNDSGMLYQTHLNSIRAATAYDGFYNTGGGMDLTGPSVILAVVDTGVDWQHPDLQNNMWAHSAGIGIDITTLGGAGPVDYNPFDVSGIGHGTHVAGLMGAISNNNQGIIGTMPYRAKIMAIKMFRRETNGDLTTTSQFFYNAVKFAYLNGAQVINLSLGAVGPGASADSLASAAVDEAVQNGSFVTVVIGNADGGAAGQVIDGTTHSSIPGQYSTKTGVVGVGSFDSNTGAKSGFSHFSTTYAEIGAPGAEQGTTGIYSTLPRTLSSYGKLAGTSQAAPLVSAAAGLTIGMIREAYGVSPTPTEVERILTASAIKSATLAPYFKDGNKLDLTSLVEKIHQDYPLTATTGENNLPPPFACTP